MIPYENILKIMIYLQIRLGSGLKKNNKEKWKKKKKSS